MAAARSGKSHTAALRLNGLFQKNPNTSTGGEVERRHGTSRGTEELACGNSRGQLKKKWNFQGKSVQEKPMWNFHGSWFLTLEFPRGVKQFWKISSKVEACFLSGISNSLSLLETF